ncbi:hypothetical protein PILCRDRAFT_820859 [Piloderma croceum F 1598]|uniref:Uncharacterized protein n=1 Tax=Piloderma croceum (strain F 1598) TaxID=765440 RepID=A0A0C3FQH9_PILCF|nr:hypothetical protein PILCRDRAFT_820859 [Piloderma croceum F 1598]
MGSRIRTVLAAAVPDRWRPQRSQTRSGSSGVVLTPTDLDNGTSAGGLGSLHGHLEPASSSQIYPSPRGSSSSGSPTRLRHDSLLNSVPEEGGVTPPPPDDDNELVNEYDEDELEWELEQMGLYRGSYSRLRTVFSIVPLSSLLLLVLLAILPPLIWPLPPGIHFPSYRNFPFPLPELLTSISLWTLSHSLRVPIYSLFFFLAPISSPAAVSDLLTATTHVLLTNLLRLCSFTLLQVRHEMDYPLPTCLDNSFRRVIWIAIGWSIAEVGVSVVQGYETLGLYNGVMVPPGREDEFLRGWKDENTGFHPEIGASSSPGTMEHRGYYEEPEEAHRHTTFMPDRTATGEIHTHELDAELAAGSRRRYLYRTASAAAIRLQLEQDIDQLLTLKAREEVEEVYGVPAIKIPVFISTLQRLSSIILSQGLSLLLSYAYLSSPISLQLPQTSPTPVLSSNRPFAITFPIIVMIHLLLSILHTPLVLPRIGLHTVSYMGLIVGLGCLFAGLGVWKALYDWIEDIGE